MSNLKCPQLLSGKSANWNPGLSDSTDCVLKCFAVLLLTTSSAVPSNWPPNPIESISKISFESLLSELPALPQPTSIIPSTVDCSNFWSLPPFSPVHLCCLRMICGRVVSWFSPLKILQWFLHCHRINSKTHKPVTQGPDYFQLLSSYSGSSHVNFLLL